MDPCHRILWGHVEFLVPQASVWYKVVCLRLCLRNPTGKSVSCGSALHRGLIAEYLKLLVGWIIQIVVAGKQRVTIALAEMAARRNRGCQVILGALVRVLPSRNVSFLDLIELEGPRKCCLVVDLVNQRRAILLLHQAHGILGSHGPLLVDANPEVASLIHSL